MQILISIIINWIVCAILTYFNIFTNDRNDVGFKARTDSTVDVIRSSPWFNIPYPGLVYIIDKSTTMVV